VPLFEPASEGGGADREVADARCRVKVRRRAHVVSKIGQVAGRRKAFGEWHWVIQKIAQPQDTLIDVVRTSIRIDV